MMHADVKTRTAGPDGTVRAKRKTSQSHEIHLRPRERNESESADARTTSQLSTVRSRRRIPSRTVTVLELRW